MKIAVHNKNYKAKIKRLQSVSKFVINQGQKFENFGEGSLGTKKTIHERISANMRHPGTRNLEVKVEACVKDHTFGRREVHIEECAPSNRVHPVSKSAHVPSKCVSPARNSEACP